MRLIVCTKRDLLGCYFLNRLLPTLAKHDVRVWLSTKTRAVERSVPELAEIAFIERTLPVDLVFPLVDRLPAAERMQAQFATFEGLKERAGVTVEVVDDVGSPSAVEYLEALTPDLMISARFSHIFKREAIAVPRHGIINLHPGALPHFAGLFAPMRTVTEGFKELTGTLHWIDEGIDSGPILAQRSRRHSPEAGLLTQTAEIYCDLIDPLLAAVSEIEAGHAPTGAMQDPVTRDYRSLPSAAELASFHAMGMVFWKPGEIRHWISRFLPTTT